MVRIAHDMYVGARAAQRRTWSVVALLIAGLAPHPGRTEVVIKLGTIAPEQSVWHDALLGISQRWRDITDGEVELRIYAGGVLGGENEMVRKMQRRTLDGVAMSGAGLPLIDDIVSCLNLPLVFDSYEELARVREAVSPRIEASFERRGYKVLGWAEAGWIRFFAREPVRTPDDLRRQRVWTSTGSPQHEALLNEFGFQVVALPSTDMLVGLQTGLIDAIDVPPLFALLDRSFQEADHMTDLDFAPLTAAIVVNLRAWRRVPEDYRDVLERAVDDSVVTLRERIHRAEREAVKEMVARGLEVVELAPEHVAQWKALAESAYPRLSCAREHRDLFDAIMRLEDGPAGGASGG